MHDERGSAPVEFILVGALLTALTLGILQLGFALYVRNVVQDAAVEGAYAAARAGATLEDGIVQTNEAITTAVGGGASQQVSAEYSRDGGYETVEVTVIAKLPLAGFLGPERGIMVTAYAPRENFDD